MQSSIRLSRQSASTVQAVLPARCTILEAQSKLSRAKA